MARHAEHEIVEVYAALLPDDCSLTYEPAAGAHPPTGSYRLVRRLAGGKTVTLGRPIPEKTVLMWERRPEVFAAIARRETGRGRKKTRPKGGGA